MSAGTRTLGARTITVIAIAMAVAIALVATAFMRQGLTAQAATSLYGDNFESDALGGPAAGWSITAGSWSVALDGTQVLKETDTNTATAKSIHAGSMAWADYAVQAQIKPGTTAVGTSNVLAARYTDDNNSYAIILKDGATWYFGKKVAGTWTTFAYGALSYKTTVWYQLEIDMVGTKLTAFINGAQVGSATDSSLRAGAIDVMSRYPVEVDNVSVTDLTPPPPPPPSPSPSPSASPSPSPGPPPGPAAISGFVSSSVTGGAVVGGTVSTQPSTMTTTTDSLGAYTLNINSGTYNVLFSAPGYNTNFVASVNAQAGGTATANETLVPLPAGSAQDLFSRPDQSALGTASDGHNWSNDLSTYPAGVAGIAGDRAFLQTTSANTDHDTWMGVSYRDEEVTADLDMVKVLTDPVYQHGARLLARVVGNDQWIVLTINPSNSTLTLWVDSSGNWTQIASASQAFGTNAWYHAKIDVVGSSVYGKVWSFGSAEPTWQVSASQTVIMSAGVGGLRAAAADVYFANFTEAPLTQISGTITDATTGKPLVGITVSLSGGATTTTGATGKYVFSSVAPGTYTVSAAPSGYHPGSVSATVTTGLSATGTDLALS